MMMYFYKRHLRFAEVYAAEIVCKTEGEESVYGTEKLMCVRLREELHTVNKAFKFKDLLYPFFYKCFQIHIYKNALFQRLFVFKYAISSYFIRYTCLKAS